CHSMCFFFFFFSSRRRHTRWPRDWSSDECSSDLCNIEWTVGGSRTEGARMQKQYSKLLLRAFNGECEAAVANVAWNNVVRMEEQIGRASCRERVWRAEGVGAEKKKKQEEGGRRTE